MEKKQRNNVNHNIFKSGTLRNDSYCATFSVKFESRNANISEVKEKNGRGKIVI